MASFFCLILLFTVKSTLTAKSPDWRLFLRGLIILWLEKPWKYWHHEVTWTSFLFCTFVNFTTVIVDTKLLPDAGKGYLRCGEKVLSILVEAE